MGTFLLGILYVFLSIGFVIPIGFMLFCLWRAYARFSGGNLSGAGLWFAAACSPFLLYGVNTTLFDKRVASRKAEVENLKRTNLARDYPSTLTLRGYLTEPELAVLLLSYDFSEIYMLQERAYRGQVEGQRFSATVSSECMAAAAKWVEDKVVRRNYANDAVLKRCVDGSRVTFDERELPQTAVVYLMDHATTLHLGNSLWSSGAYEVRLRSNGDDVLVDYWERLHAERQASPFCLPKFPMCGSTEFNQKDQIDRFKFLIKALGHA